MPLRRPLLQVPQPGLRAGALLRALPEGLLLLLAVVAIEITGGARGSDLLALPYFGGMVVLGLCLRALAQRNLAPISQAIWHRARRGSRRFLLGLFPRYAVGFRLVAGVAAPRDTALLVPIALLWLAGLGAAAGAPVLPGLLALAGEASATVHLALLGGLWVLLALPFVACIVAFSHGFLLGGPGGSREQTILLLAILALLGVLLASVAPTGVILGLLALIPLAWLRPYRDYRVEPYGFCRRDRTGGFRVLAVRSFLLRIHLLAGGILFLLGALAATGGLLETPRPRHPLLVTTWLGVVALPVLVLLSGAIAGYLARVASAARTGPDRPLIPMVWSRAIEAPPPAWIGAATDLGWETWTGPRPPEEGFDLTHGFTGHKYALNVPTAALPPDELRFRLQRRFHVVMRRRFRRRMEQFVAQLRPHRRTPGSGFLFCPHVWLIPGPIREGAASRARSAALAGPRVVTPPYARAFDMRLRRYLGGILRSLHVDLIYWEDSVTWRDLRRVFAIVFECADQGHCPLRARHFHGLPRLRVLIQEEGADPTPIAGDSERAPSPLSTRVLVILRDRGGGEEPPTPSPDRHSRRIPAYGVR